MAWTYSGDPSASQRDAVRFLIGDTITADQLLQDAEIDFCIAQQSGSYLAAAMACESICALYSRLADSSIGDVSQSMSQKSAQYSAKAEELRRRAAINVLPGFGGISQSAKDDLNSDTDAVAQTFAKGLDDIPGAPSGLVPNDPQDPFLDIE